jgi:uncharacterized protein YprB with RNaseH-like and TPR domain
MILRERLESLGYQVRAAAQRPSIPLEALAAALGGEVRHNARGAVVAIEEVLRLPPRSMPYQTDTVCRLGVAGLDRLPEASLCFFDTETTGLSSGAGNQVFLIAMAWRLDGALLLRQYLLADPAQEAAFLEAVSVDLGASQALVSYNGRSFDSPVLESRMVMARRLAGLLDKPHLDLLHPVRRIFKSRLGSCSLGNVESMVLGRDREDDVPGYLIPEIYFTFLRRRDPELLRGVMQHNRQDVVSLSLLLDHLCQTLALPGSCHPLDRLGVARLLEATGDVEAALVLYRAMWDESAVGWDGEAWPGAWTPVELGYVVGMRLATICRRQRHDPEAEQILAELWRRHPAPWEAGIMLAKLLEHRRRDCGAALELVTIALEALEEQGDRSPREERCLADLRRRRRRLSGKLAT